VIDSHVDPTGVLFQVVDPVGSNLSQSWNLKIMYPDGLRLSLSVSPRVPRF
jgi:hypothetical protein